MKKVLYAVLFAFSLTLTFTACTEDEVAPKTEQENGGGGGSVDPLKP